MGCGGRGAAPTARPRNCWGRGSGLEHPIHGTTMTSGCPETLARASAYPFALVPSRALLPLAGWGHSRLPCPRLFGSFCLNLLVLL